MPPPKELNVADVKVRKLEDWVVDVLRASLDKSGKAGSGTVKAVTDLVSALAKGVKAASRVSANPLDQAASH